MLPARAFLVKMILLQKVILLFKLNNPVATMKEVVFLVMDDACKRLFFNSQLLEEKEHGQDTPMKNFWHTELNGAGGLEHDHAGHRRLDQDQVGLGELGHEDNDELHHDSEIQYRVEHGDLGQDHVQKRVFSSFNIGHARSK